MLSADILFDFTNGNTVYTIELENETLKLACNKSAFGLYMCFHAILLSSVKIIFTGSNWWWFQVPII